jgi:hypothetical protein
MSERTTFRSAMTGRSMILTLMASLSPSVLWQTRCCGLPANMVPRASGRKLNRRTTKLHLSRRQEQPSGRFTLKNRKLKKNLQNLIFLKSVSEHACIIH